MIGTLIVAVAGADILALAMQAGASMDLNQAVIGLWIVNAFLVMYIGMRLFPELPVWVGLMLCAVGCGLVFGLLPVIGAALFLSLAPLGLRLRRLAAVDASVSRRLDRMAATD
jgi:hypothetical protein